MAHGHPDYGGAAPLATIYPVIDIGELAARLGSVVTFDRRGNVIWLDDFEDVVNKWYSDSDPTQWPAVQSADTARSGSFSAFFETAYFEDAWAGIIHYQVKPVLGKLGFEFSFARGQFVKEITHRVLIYTSTERYSATIKWIAATNSLQYLADDGDYHDLTPSLEFPENCYLFNTMKLVVDFINCEYVRLIANDITFDMSGLKFHKIVDTSTPHVEWAILVTTNINGPAQLYVDDAIFTQNEP